MTFLRSCVALVAVLASPPSFACGFHDSVQLQKGILNWVYPDSLHVGTAVWMAQEAGRLARDNLAGNDDLTPEARNRLGYLRASLLLAKFRLALDAVRGSGSRPNMSVVLLGPVLWSRYENTEAQLRLELHVGGPAQGDVVVVTDAPVIDALVAGRLGAREALELGVVRVYGSAADSGHAIEWLSAIH